MATTEFDFERARYNMIEQQIRTWAVLDQDVLDLLFVVRREEFVPPQYRTIAFVDFEIPLPNGTGARQADVQWSDSMTVGTGGTTIDLTAIVDSLGRSKTMRR